MESILFAVLLCLCSWTAGWGIAADVGSSASKAPWNVKLPATEGHTGRIAIVPSGQIHEGRGHTGVLGAACHFHSLDQETGRLSWPGIPCDEQGKPLTGGDAQDQKPPELGFVLDERAQQAILAHEWQVLADTLGNQDECLLFPEARFLMGHALLACNRNDEAFWLFFSSGTWVERSAWEDWAQEYLAQHSESPVAHYLLGDALARLERWTEAEERLGEALRLDSGFGLARSARGMVRVARGSLDGAVEDLTAVAEEHPQLVEGHLALGALFTHIRAGEGAQSAFDKALSISSGCALALNGRGCAEYGLGNWELANRDLAEAGRRGLTPLVLENLRALALACENCSNPAEESSPLFRATDFLDWDFLCDVNDREGDILKEAMGHGLPDILDERALVDLNTLLEDPRFADKYKDRIDLSQVSGDIGPLLDETLPLRRKAHAELSDKERQQIVRLNRTLLECAYPCLIAQHRQRDPGLELNLSWQEALYGRVHNPLLVGLPRLSLKVPKMPTITIPKFLKIEFPKGVSTDMRRAYVDTGHWSVAAPSSLAYRIPSVTDGIE